MTDALTQAWRALGGAPGDEDTLAVTGPSAILPGPLPCGDAAVACAGSALLAARELAAARGMSAPDVALDRGDVAASFTSEAWLRVGGASPGAGFAPLSRMLRCAGDGWVRTHGNYPHHRRALMGVLGIDAPDPEAAHAAAAGWDAVELEDAIVAAGGCAAALRTPERWAAHPAGAALPATLAGVRGGGLSPRRLGPASLPADGVRVLDLTRVIAGPVAGRTLGALGADVLRIDAPDAVEMQLSLLDTAVGKRSARLDLADTERVEALLAQADVVIQGYRPGALARFGLDPKALARRHPHLVGVSLSAWGDSGPWGTRRGFDSLVQVGAGIATTVTADGDEQPGRLPCQLLDHGTGHLAAAAALLGLARRERTGVATHTTLALARTSAWLLGLPREAAPPQPRTQRFGEIELVVPPGSLDGAPLRWRSAPPRELGADAARFRRAP